MLIIFFRIVHGKHTCDVYMARNFKQCKAMNRLFKQNQTNNKENKVV